MLVLLLVIILILALAGGIFISKFLFLWVAWMAVKPSETAPASPRTVVGVLP